MYLLKLKYFYYYGCMIRGCMISFEEKNQRRVLAFWGITDKNIYLLNLRRFYFVHIRHGFVGIERKRKTSLYMKNFKDIL